MCTSNGSDDVAAGLHAFADGAERCRVLRGGCYGLCEIGPNVVVRRHVGEFPSADVDRLSLTDAANETVYSKMSPAEGVDALRSHLDRDEAIERLTRDARERELPPKSPVAAKLRALREKRRHTA